MSGLNELNHLPVMKVNKTTIHSTCVLFTCVSLNPSMFVWLVSVCVCVCKELFDIQYLSNQPITHQFKPIDADAIEG